jgi:predicted amidohydrolase YtcJ
LPIRFEHVPICPPALADEMAHLEVSVVTQPGFIRASGDRYLQDVEPHFLRWLYPIRTLIRAGVNVRAGSDAPIGPVDPLIGIRAAVNRTTESGARVAEAESITVDEARQLYAATAAEAQAA